MSNSMDDRRNANESKYARDQQLEFKVEARASKLMGLWAAELMGLTGTDAENYAKEVIGANLDEPGFDDVKRKLQKDFDTKGIEIEEHAIDVQIQKQIEKARQQIAEEVK